MPLFELDFTRWSILMLAALWTASGGGCSRDYHRLQADRQAYSLIQEKTDPERWPLLDHQIDIEPRSRMYDPFSPDFPPMPPDDPASHTFMHCADCRRGYPCWSANGDTSNVESPNWRAYLPIDERGVVVMDQERAISLALLHSPTYQQELEDLYLSALDVSFERFRFDHQFFGGYSATYTADGRVRGGGQSSSLLDLSTFPRSRGIRMEKFYTTGASLVAGFANSLMWQLAGPDNYSTTTLLDFSLVQPLLRAAGRDRIMERLTVAERILLANVRQMERYRRGFYLEVATGISAGPGPSRRGGFFGGSGLEGFSGVGGGGFGGVGQSSFGGGGGGGAGAQSAGGFMGLLQDRLTIRNQESNIASLRSSLAQLDAFFDAGRIDYFQVELARQALFDAESRLLNSRASYHGTLDSFKIDLGLPPDVPVEIRDGLLNQFDLIDTATIPLQNRLTEIQEEVGHAIVDLLPSADNADLTRLPASQASVIANLQRLIDQAEAIRHTLETEMVQRALTDVESLRQAIPERRKQARMLKRQLASDRELDSNDVSIAQLIDESQLIPLPNHLQENVSRTADRLGQQKERLAAIAQHLHQLESQHRDPNGSIAPSAVAELQQLPNELNVLASNALELALMQARARTESVSLVPVELDWQSAFQVARDNRRDWMNTRAALVDSWRLIEFNADNLESQLDIVFSGDIGNIGDNPFQLRDTTGRLRVGLQFDAPITRLSERNTYRQALIEYQQARRSYYRYRDSVMAGLRGTLRSVRLNHLNFELRRAAVQVAITQVELTRLRLQEPPRPNEELVFSVTTARDLVSALSALLTAQNDFLSVWVNHEVLRRSLDFNLGTMQLDAYGIWIDPGPIGDEPAGVPSAEELPSPEASAPPERLPVVHHGEEALLVRLPLPPDYLPETPSAPVGPMLRDVLLPSRPVRLVEFTENDEASE